MDDIREFTVDTEAIPAPGYLPIAVGVALMAVLIALVCQRFL